PETATEKPIIRIEIYGFNIYEKANAESILLTEEDIQKAGRGGVKSILRDYLGENTDFVCDYLIKDFEEMKDYRDGLVKAERGKEEKKETKPKEEAVVEKLAELIEEKERLAKERAKEERKAPKPRKHKIHIPEEIREEIESVCKEAVEERLREILGRIGAELKGAEKLECLCISCQRPIEGEYRVLGCEVYCIYCARKLEKEKKEKGESVSWNPENKCICAGCRRAVSTFRCSGGICYCLSCARKFAGELVFDDERGPVEREIREAVREALLYYLGS
ncbi:hypothetical protein DRN52_05690, partial [Thermococci archaeon]